MENIRLLIDFGSTFTKVVAVDLDREEVVSVARVPSTVDTDVTVGLEQAFNQINAEVKITDLQKKKAMACSSAAGGLRMVCVGFVPELTSEAANRAALGAGAKVVGRYSYQLTSKEVEEIESIAPDILLLAGGTDGGNEKVILHNARALAKTNHTIKNVVIAGNKATHDEIREIYKDFSGHVFFTKNVMPEIGVLDAEPCNKEVREIFIKHIIEAKGIAKVRAMIEEVIMPTPSAGLEAARLIAQGCKGSQGLGEILVVDVGGATTNVHSIATGKPTGNAIVMDHLPEPYIKRTVEGDIGLKYNIATLEELAQQRERPPDFDTVVKRFYGGKLPEGESESICHDLMSNIAVETAVNRHVGRLEVIYSTSGEIFIQRGKDLTQIKTVIGTGGGIIFAANPRQVLEGALYKNENNTILKPKAPTLYIDECYIFFAIGLLGQVEPAKALNLIKKHLKKV
jgi:uncharacterized protein (TIGR01319 family)